MPPPPPAITRIRALYKSWGIAPANQKTFGNLLDPLHKVTLVRKARKYD